MHYEIRHYQTQPGRREEWRRPAVPTMHGTSSWPTSEGRRSMVPGQVEQLVAFGDIQPQRSGERGEHLL